MQRCSRSRREGEHGAAAQPSPPPLRRKRVESGNAPERAAGSPEMWLLLMAAGVGGGGIRRGGPLSTATPAAGRPDPPAAGPVACPRGQGGHAAAVTHLTLRLSALPSVLECLRFLGRPGPRRAGLRELSSRLQPRQDRGHPEPRGHRRRCPSAEPG